MSEKLPCIDCQELVRALERIGIVKKRQKGGPLHMWRDTDKKRVMCLFSEKDHAIKKVTRYSSVSRHQHLRVS